MRHLLIVIMAMVVLTLTGTMTFAHKASDSYLRLTVEDTTMTGEWDMALRDLEYAIGLDSDTNGLLTWREIQAQQESITEYGLSRLNISSQGEPCWTQATDHLIDHHTDGAYAVMRFSITCPQTISTVDIDYRFLFDLDPLHRGLLSLRQDGKNSTAVLSPDEPTVHFDLKTSSKWRAIQHFWREGIWHIWIGVDHILFLISLLLPAVLWWQNGQWNPKESFQAALLEVLKIVTAFTIAHSITLSLAALGMISLPSRWVESIIAASVLLAALHNIFPIIHKRLWIVTFLFGLIHGLGFASVLIDLGLPSESLAFALAGFNLGVEFGQVAIIIVLIPLAYILRHTWAYQRLVLKAGSLTIALIASIWLMERSLDLNITSGVW